jgi:hypothetical protein
VSVRDLNLSIPDDITTGPLSALSEEEGGSDRPLENLETLTLASLSPWIWEHLSRVGVKLTGLALTTTDYNAITLKSADPSGRILHHLLRVISGSICSILNTATAAPRSIRRSIRRSLAFHPFRTATGIRPGSTVQLEEPRIFFCEQHSLQHALSQGFPRLRHLEISEFSVDDTTFAQALRGARRTLESLHLSSFRLDFSQHWRRAALPETVEAIGTLRELRSLKLRKLQNSSLVVTHKMLEPILIGKPPTQAPLCAKIRAAHISLPSKSPQFIMRLRKSIRRRFPNIREEDVDGE